ncbi:MAG: hypothetical protein JWQ35_1221 [Bacteriovoracaceae bacterium]|nr:hypothetical protein [Bacteriovoracaceae bacterium]
MKIVQILAKIVGLLFVLIIILGGIFIIRPEWILTPRAMDFLVRHLASSYHPSWKELQIYLTSETWSKKKLSIQASDLCIKNTQVEGCLTTLNFNTEINWSSLTHLTFSSMNLLAVSDSFKLVKSQGGSETKLVKSQPSLPSFNKIENYFYKLGPWNWKDLNLSIKKLEWNDATYSISIERKADPISAIHWSVMSEALQFTGSWIASDLQHSVMEGNFKRESDMFSFQFRPNTFQRNAYFLNIKADLAKQGFSFEAPLQVQFNVSAIRFGGNIQVKWNNRNIVLSIRALQFFVDPKRHQLKETNFSSELYLTSTEEWAKLIRLDTEANYQFKNAHLSLKTKNMDPSIDLKIDISCELAFNKSKKLNCDRSPIASIGMPYAVLVELLRGSSYAIFAPFQVLKGPINLAFKATDNLNEFSLEGSTHLQSAHQKVNLTASGKLSHPLSKKRSLDLDLRLQEVELQLPNLDPKKMPVLARDSRIQIRHSTPAPKPSLTKSPFPFHIVLTTEKPLLLRSNLAVQPVPLTMNLDLTHQTRAGTISAKPFDIQIFRRKAHVERLDLNLVPQSNIIELMGLVDYITPEAKIQIHLTGQASKPNIHFTSEPPLQQNEILSLLLFGRSSFASLSAEEEATVGNAQVALASGAFSLASIYLFASTPIEAIGYDPITHAYSVTVRLPGGISAEYGKTFDEQDHGYLTFRKSLGRHWMLSTEWENYSDERSSIVSTFIQWFNRF